MSDEHEPTFEYALEVILQEMESWGEDEINAVIVSQMGEHVHEQELALPLPERKQDLAEYLAFHFTTMTNSKIVVLALLSWVRPE